jgi:hypothetical protein
LYAGASAEWPVSIEFDTADSGRAFGLMWTVRSSRNDVEGIGCSYRSNVEKVEWEHFPWDHPVNNWAWCQAQDAGGVQVWCFTENQHLLDALQAISPFSFLLDSVWWGNARAWTSRPSRCTCLFSAPRSSRCHLIPGVAERGPFLCRLTLPGPSSWRPFTL